MPIPPVLVAMLREWVEQNDITPPDQLLFRTRTTPARAGRTGRGRGTAVLDWPAADAGLRLPACGRYDLAPSRHAAWGDSASTRAQRGDTRLDLRRRVG